MFYEENGAEYEFMNQFQLGVSIGLGIVVLMKHYKSEVNYRCSLAFGSCYGSVLGSDIYRFDVIGSVRDQAECNLRHSINNSVCIDRELEKRYAKIEQMF